MSINLRCDSWMSLRVRQGANVDTPAGSENLCWICIVDRAVCAIATHSFLARRSPRIPSQTQSSSSAHLTLCLSMGRSQSQQVRADPSSQKTNNKKRRRSGKHKVLLRSAIHPGHTLAALPRCPQSSARRHPSHHTLCSFLAPSRLLPRRNGHQATPGQRHCTSDLGPKVKTSISCPAFSLSLSRSLSPGCCCCCGWLCRRCAASAAWTAATSAAFWSMRGRLCDRLCRWAASMLRSCADSILCFSRFLLPSSEQRSFGAMKKSTAAGRHMQTKFSDRPPKHTQRFVCHGDPRRQRFRKKKGKLPRNKAQEKFF